MRLHLAVAALLAWQAGSGAPPTGAGAGRAADPEHLRYERALALPAGASGQACATLDASVYADSAEASARDLRLFAAGSDGQQHEVPYAISRSAAQPGEAAAASVRNASVEGDTLRFDLAMPGRAYSAVDLQIGARDFVAIATVSTARAGAADIELGTFVLFDLSGQQLGRSTTLALEEAQYPGLRPAMISGAIAPPSRQAQVLYSPVAQSTGIATKGRATVLSFAPLAAHVPVERVRLVLPLRHAENFLRRVTLEAKPQSGSPFGLETETLHGEIASVSREAAGAAPAIHYQQLTIPATLGSNLDTPAKITVTIDNGKLAPLPVASALLEMQQRNLCFAATPDESYALRYGDASMPAPASDYARGFTPQAKPVEALLGPERQNPTYVPRAEDAPYVRRHPEASWVGLLIVVAAAATLLVDALKRRRHR
jgi:hypothetical protein